MKTTLHIKGMDCNNCATGISNMLRKKGLHDAVVNFATGEAIYTEQATVPIESIIKGIEELGYKVSGKNEEAFQQGAEFFNIEKKLLISALFTLPLLLHMLPIPLLSDFWLQMILCLPVFTIGVLHFGKSAYASLKTGVPNMDVLIFTGSSAAFIYSILGFVLAQNKHEAHHYLFFETSASIITLVLLGNFLEHKAVNKTTSAIKNLAALKPTKVNIVIDFNGKEKILETDLSNLKPGDLLMVRNGDSIPADGLVVSGEAELNESFLTGESLPAFKKLNSTVYSGTVVLNGNLKVRAEKIGNETLLSGIIDMIKNAQFQKPKVQKLADNIASVFVPIVIIISILTFLTNYFAFQVILSESIMRSIAVLVISCPCAMGLATPTAVMVGIGRAAREGILIKGGETLQQLAKIKQLAFDKTGTITTGHFVITDMKVFLNKSITDIKNILYSIEKKSNHPLAKSIVKAFDHEAIELPVESFEEVKGSGINARIDGKNYFVGKSVLEGLQLILTENENVIAQLSLQDELKPQTESVLHSLNKAGLKLNLISGDLNFRCKEMAGHLPFDTIYAEKKPDEKPEIIKTLKKNGSIAMVGDGINDAPALAVADVGVAMGNGTDIAIQSGQVVLLNGDLQKLINAIFISKATLKTIHQNLFWAFFYNLIAIPLAAAGFLNPMMGAIAMALSDVMVIGNSLWLNIKNIKGNEE